MSLTNTQYTQIVFTVISLVVALIFVILMTVEENEDKRDVYMIVAIVSGAIGIVCGIYTAYSIYSMFSMFKTSRSLSNDLYGTHETQLRELQNLFDEVISSNVIMSSFDKQKLEKIKKDMEMMIEQNRVGLSYYPMKPDMEEWIDKLLRENMQKPNKQYLKRMADEIDQLRDINEFVTHQFNFAVTHPIIKSYLIWNENRIRLDLDHFMRKEHDDMEAEEREWERKERQKKNKKL